MQVLDGTLIKYQILLILDGCLKLQRFGGYNIHIPISHWTIFRKRYHFIQTADIDATETIVWNNGSGFVPIGYYELDMQTEPRGLFTRKNYFCGVYDGNRFSINNLHIRHRDISIDDMKNNPFFMGSPVGLFAGIKFSLIKNVRLNNVNIVGFHNTGAIAGDAFKSRIRHSSTSGNVSSMLYSIRTGGILGSASRTQIQFCYSNVMFDSEMNRLQTVGGLVGFLHDRSSIENSYFSGIIVPFDNNTFIGGIAGVAVFLHIGLKENAHLKRQRAFINNTYVANSSNAINLVGEAQNVLISNSFWYIETTDSPKTIDMARSNDRLYFVDVESTRALTIDEMREKSHFTGWDFENIWKIDPDKNNGLPFLEKVTCHRQNRVNVITATQ
jgi:hypothetical protein